MSLKISSFFSATIFFIITVFIERRFFKLSKNIRLVAYISIFYIIILQSYLFIGVNDLLLDVFATIVFLFIFIESGLEFSKRSKINFFLIRIFIGFMLCTRKMALVYLPSILLLLFFISNAKILELTKKSIYVFIGITMVLVILNFPSIVENKKLSFDDKVLKHDVNWAQLDYYNIQKVQSGEIVRRKHVNINEVKEYLLKNGNNSLPNTFLEMITFDYKVTLIEFYYGLKDSFFGFLRSLGLLFLFGIGFFLFNIFNLSKINLKDNSNLILLFAVSFTILISFIVVSYVQFRWFMIFLPLLILSLLKKFQELKWNDNIKSIFLISHIIILFIMNLPFLLKVLNK